MQVYSLMGLMEYERPALLGVYGSLELLLDSVRQMEALAGDPEEDAYYFQGFGYVVSELGARVDGSDLVALPAMA